MKKIVYLSLINLVAFTLFFVTPASAAHKSKSTALPIDGGIVLLALAGVAIGIFAVVKVKAAKKVAHK